MMEEVIINTLSNYGVLGLWTMMLIYERFKQQKELKNTIENNTVALTRFYEVTKKCSRR